MRQTGVMLTVLGASLLLACGGNKQAPAAPDVPVTPPTAADTATAAAVTPDTSTGAPDTSGASTAAADTAAAVAAAPDTVAPPEPPVAYVIAAERRKALAELDPKEAEQEPPALTLVDKCPSTDPQDDGDVIDCQLALAPGVVGFHPDGRVALLSTDEEGGCGDWGPRLTGRIVSLPRLKSVGDDVAFPDPEDAEDETIAPKATWAWLKTLPAAGFTPAHNLIVHGVEQPSGIRAHLPTAVLAEPLAGWIIDAERGKGVALVKLVSPDMRKAYVLGVVRNISGECSEEDRADGMCADFTAPSVNQVVLTPDRSRFLVTATMGDGTHCGVDKLKVVAWPVPRGVFAAPAPKP